MKNLFLLTLVMLLTVGTLSLQAQDKKEKKKKKKKAQIENNQTLQESKDNGKKPVEIKPVETKPVETIETKPQTKQPVLESQEIKPTNLQPATTDSKKPVITLEQVMQQAKPVVDQKPNGAINWTEQYIEAKGQSVIDNEKFKNVAQAKAMATRGAVVVAQRNLLEIVQGVNVTSETKVKDMITESDYIYTRVDGLVKGAQQVGDAIEKDGMMEVTMRIPIYSSKGLAPVVYDNVPNAKAKKGEMAAVVDAAEALQAGDLGGGEGFVFNFNGKQIDPSMFPVVVDENGKVLLDFYKLYDPTTGKFPQMLQQSKDLFQQLGFNKGVEVIDVAQSFNGKIQLDKVNAGKINWEKIGKFAQSAGKVLKFALALI